MGVTLGARFVAYDPAGARRGILPYPLAAAVRDVFNDVSGGSIDYLADAQHSPLLEGLCEIAAEVNDGRGWTEFGARMMRLKRGASEIEETRTRRYTLHSYGQQLAKMRMLREEALDENGERVLTAATAGSIVKTLFDEAKTRGAVSAFTYDFTAAADSNGKAWGSALPPMTLRFGDDLLSLLRMLADNGACDWKIQGRTLRMFKPDTLGADKSATIRLFNGADILEAPDDEDATEMAGRIGVIGDEGRTYEAISPSMNPWGLWEETVNASGVKDIGGLQFIGEAEQRRRSAPRVQMTRKLRTVNVKHLPVLDYTVGDTITVPGQDGTAVAVRVRELQLDLSAEGVGVNATLNDLILERDIRDRRNWQGMLGGASSSAGGTGSPSIGDDKRAPAVPTGFVCSSAHLWSPTGEQFAVLSSAFVPVTKGADGRDITVAKHELYGRLDQVGEVWRKITDVGAGDSRITYSPLPTGEAWQFKLRAVSTAGVPGDFCDAVSLTLAADTEPPPKPAPPDPSTRLGQIMLFWAGQTDPPGAQAIDFSHCEVVLATSPAGAGEVVGRMGAQDTFVAPQQPYNEPRWFSLVAVDVSGNRSEESTRVVVSAKPLVDTDVIGEVISGANILDGSVNAAEKVIAESITGRLIEAEAIDTGHMKANSVTTDKLVAGAVTAEKVQANSITASKLTIGDFTNLAAPPRSPDWSLGIGAAWYPSSAFAAGYGLWGQGAPAPWLSSTSPTYDAVAGEQFRCSAKVNRSAGTIATLGSSGIGVQFFDGNGQTLASVTVGSTASPGITLLSGVATAPAGTKSARFYSFLTAATSPDPTQFAFAGDFECRRMTSGGLLVDGAIDGKTITGAMIRTAAIGERTEMTPAGIRTLNAAGQELVRIGHGIETGMSVRNPYTGSQVPLAPFAFGTVGFTKEGFLNVPKPAGTSNASSPIWGSYVDDWVGGDSPVMSPSGRILLICGTEVSELAVAQNCDFQTVYDLMEQYNNNSASYIRAFSNVSTSRGANTYTRVVNVVPGKNYWLRNSQRALMYANVSTIRVGPRTMIAMPI